MRTKIIYIVTMLIAGLGLSACNDDNKPSFDFSPDVEIRSFTIDGVKGTIDEERGTIYVLLPARTDVTALRPAIEVAEGATVTPSSGEAVDFTGRVEYLVENGDLYQKYIVTVDVVKALITRFVVAGTEGEIDQGNWTITAWAGEGADLTAIVPIVDYTTGATITPADGQPVDFTNPVKYTLAYEGSTFEYTVTVLAQDPPLPPLVFYNGEDIIGGWWDAGAAPDLDLKTRNPKPNSVNSTEYCASFTFDKGADPWRGAGLSDVNVDPNVYNRFSAMILKDSPGLLRMEIQGSGGDNMSIEHQYDPSRLGEWQEFIFELPDDHTYTNIHTILVAPHLEDTADDPAFYTQKMYFDEVKALPKTND